MKLVNKKTAYDAMVRGAKVAHLDLLEENPSHFYQFDGKDIRDENGILVDPLFFNEFASDIDCWKILTTDWQVPFQAEETVWNNCVAIVTADTKEKAYSQIAETIKEGGNPFSLDISCDWAGVNTVTDEVFETSKYCIGEEYSSSIDDVKPYYSLPYRDKSKGYQNATAASIKLTLEIDVNSLDVDVKSILEGLEAELVSNGTDKHWKQYSIQTLRQTLNDDTDDEFKDVFYGVWNQFVNYCIQQNADYVLFVK